MRFAISLPLLACLCLAPSFLQSSSQARSSEDHHQRIATTGDLVETHVDRSFPDQAEGDLIPLTAEEQESRPGVERAADHFIDRWHQTLDFNVLFDELYVTGRRQRLQNLSWFVDFYRHLAGRGENPAIDKDIDERIVRAGFVAFYNMWYLGDEYELAYRTDDNPSPRPPGFDALMKSLDGVTVDPIRMRREVVLDYASKAETVAAVFRASLPPAAFRSAVYRENLRLQEERRRPEKKTVQVLHGMSNYGIPESVEVYALERGLFRFFFIEENGKMKVLKLGF